MRFRLPITVAAMAIIASAAPAPVLADPPTEPPPVDPAMTRTGTISIETIGPRHERFSIASAAMRRAITVDVLHGSGSGPHPLLYLLDGVDGEAISGWLSKGGAAEFFADKPVDVVLTSGGTGSMYSDWMRRDATLGSTAGRLSSPRNCRRSSNPILRTDGRRAIAGVSMGAQAAMMLPNVIRAAFARWPG